MNTYYAVNMGGDCGYMGHCWGGVRRGASRSKEVFSTEIGVAITNPSIEQSLVIRALEGTPEAIEGWYDSLRKEVTCVNARGFTKFFGRAVTEADVDAILAS